MAQIKAICTTRIHCTLYNVVRSLTDFKQLPELLIFQPSIKPKRKKEHVEISQTDRQTAG